MQLKLTAALFSILIIAVSACGQSKKTASVKNGETYAKVLQANLQRTLPGAPGMEPVNEYRILINWKSSETPETFFWRSEGDWIECSVAKAKKTKASAQGITYTAEAVSLGKIKKNDTLELLPVTGGKYPIPSSIPETATNTVFFKTAKSAWLSLPVKNIKKAKDIVMP
ncbi:MAG: hypothetical protein K0R82_888 [Flavipsychrobacter sp.]|jgi:hypothetical protein|nr:hypothetical protein [Flavipsychrobacter sp.]